MTLRRTPFHSCHVDAGARMVPFAGFEMPVQYTGLAEEHRAVREAAGLFDVSHMGEVRVRGARAEEALQHLLSNGILRLKPGHAQYNMMCNERGGVVDDVFVYRLAEDDFLVCVNAANANPGTPDQTVACSAVKHGPSSATSSCLPARLPALGRTTRRRTREMAAGAGVSLSRGRP